MIKDSGNHKGLKMIKTKMKNITNDVEASNKNLKGNENRKLVEYVTPRAMLILGGKNVDSQKFATK